MRKEQPLGGSIITDRDRLAEIEALWTRHEDLLWNRVAGQYEASDEIAKTLADAFGVSASDQRLLTGNHLNRMLETLITASKNAILIADRGLGIGAEVVFGSRKRRHARITGYTRDNRLYLQLSQSPELKQRNLTRHPFEVERVGKSFAESTREKIQAAFQLLNVDNFHALSLAYTKEDQRLMKSGEWDDENPELITNQTKNILEQMDPTQLNEDDQVWWHEILWFWYHHAISCAIWKRKDKALAQRYAKTARELQGSLGHPNRITELLRLLVGDEYELAKEMVACLEAEAETARLTLEEYERGEFF